MAVSPCAFRLAPASTSARISSDPRRGQAPVGARQSKGPDTRVPRRAFLAPRGRWCLSPNFADPRIRRSATLPPSRLPIADKRATLEPLKTGRKGQYSIRINLQYRVRFRWEPDGAYDVEITDYHRGDRKSTRLNS